MKKFYIILILSLIITSVNSQSVTIIPWPDGIAPVIDGVEDDIWQYVDLNQVTLKFGTELPTLNPGTGFKAAWNDTALFLIVYVNDDFHCDRWCSGAADSLSDKVEIFFDVNDTLHDGIGASTMYSGNGTGHYRFAPDFDSSFETGVTEGANLNMIANIWHYGYAYVITDPNYIEEFYIRINTDGGLTKKDGSIWVPGNCDTILFECTVIDRDPGDSGRRRSNWHTPEGTGIDEAWNNMDVAGRVTISTYEFPVATTTMEINDNCGFKNINTKSITHPIIFPNPASNQITIFGATEINRVTITDILGRTLKILQNHNAGNLEIDISDLNNGIYFIKLTDKDRNTYTRRFVKAK